MPHNLLQNIASVLSVNHRNPRIVESCSQEANFDLASEEDYSSKTVTVTSVRNSPAVRGDFYWDRLCLYSPPQNSEIVQIYPHGSLFLVLLLGAIDSPSTDALV